MIFIRNSANYNLVLRNWNACCWVRCWEVTTFWELAYDSMQFVATQIEAIDRVDGNTPFGFDTTANIVPKSPTSRSTSTHAGESTQE